MEKELKRPKYTQKQLKEVARSAWKYFNEYPNEPVTIYYVTFMENFDVSWGWPLSKYNDDALLRKDIVKLFVYNPQKSRIQPYQYEVLETIKNGMDGYSEWVEKTNKRHRELYRKERINRLLDAI